MNGIKVNRPHDFCPKGCKNFKPTIENGTIYADNERYEVEYFLHCKHEDICEQIIGNKPEAPHDNA